MKERKKEKKNLIKKIRENPTILLIIFVIIVFMSPMLLSTAKYIYNILYDYYLGSKDFYFSSDKLGINHTEYEATNNWPGAQTYPVPVLMSSKRNDLAYTESDITYTIEETHSSNITCSLSKITGTIPGTSSLTPQAGANVDSFIVNISPAGSALSEGAVAWVELVVESTSPYVQQLTGRIVIEVSSSDITYEIIDAVNQPYLTVNITNSQSTAADVKLSYDPTDVLLDMTSRFYLNNTTYTTQTLNGYTYLDSITSNVGSLSTTTVKFYKIDPTQNYSYSAGSQAQPIITLSHNGS